MAPEHPPSPDATLLAHDPDAAAQQQAQQVQHQHAHAQEVAVQDHANGALHAARPKTPGSSRRGKQYKCGNCGELGHNTKTCPRRGPGGAETQVIQPALDASDMFAVGGLGTPVGRTSGTVPAVGRVQPLKLEAAIDAANRRVLAAEVAVAGATTNEEFEEATSALDLAVSQLERIGACAKRCALVAYSLSTPSLDISPAAAPMRDGKRIRLDNGTQPIAPRMDDAEQQDVQQPDAEALQKLETVE